MCVDVVVPQCVRTWVWGDVIVSGRSECGGTPVSESVGLGGIYSNGKS